MLHEGLSAAPELIDVHVLDTPESREKPQDECGVIAIYAPGEPVIGLAYRGLKELQHRGQGSAGIAYNGSGEQQIIVHKNVGLVPVAIGKEVAMLPDRRSAIDVGQGPKLVIGQVRYPTAGTQTAEAAHPFLESHGSSSIALAQNGETYDVEGLAAQFGVDVADYPTDTAVLTKVINKQVAERGNLENGVTDVLKKTKGGYCLVITDGKQVMGVRDEKGYHPLALGEFPDGKGYVLASEAVAFKAMGAQFKQDVRPGEIITIDENGFRSSWINGQEPQEPKQECIFEYAYTARPDGFINGVSVTDQRVISGRLLAEDHPVSGETDESLPLVVVGAPESGLLAAYGYAEGAGITYAPGIGRNIYTGRSFIETGYARDDTLDSKFRPLPGLLAGKRVVVVDDSMIKGNTMRKLVADLREAGAVEVHIRLATPEYIDSCYMGMATHEHDDLIARGMTNEQIARAIGANSVAFLGIDRVEQAVREAAVDDLAKVAADRLCRACTTGVYPFELTDKDKAKRAREQVLLPMPGVRLDLVGAEKSTS